MKIQLKSKKFQEWVHSTRTVTRRGTNPLYMPAFCRQPNSLNREKQWMQSFQLLNTGQSVSDLERCQTYTCLLSKGRICAWFKARWVPDCCWTPCSHWAPHPCSPRSDWSTILPSLHMVSANSPTRSTVWLRMNLALEAVWYLWAQAGSSLSPGLSSIQSLPTLAQRLTLSRLLHSIAGSRDGYPGMTLWEA